MAHYITRASLQNPLRLTNLARTRWTITLATSRKMSTNNNYEHIITSRPEPNVLLIQLNRPKALNALCSPLFLELNQALREADKDDTVGAMVLTGSEKAFAGAYFVPGYFTSALYGGGGLASGANRTLILL